MLGLAAFTACSFSLAPFVVPVLPRSVAQRSNVHMWDAEEAYTAGIDPTYLAELEAWVAELCYNAGVYPPQQCVDGQCKTIDVYMQELKQVTMNLQA